jgi:exonuclease SbcC|uniref:Chromosome segregation protein n=1 Tax=Myoviridae sp. ctxlX31 TaxID=2827293 RepID=A0A8S5R3U0_9CAUD|nr:MAG TPA: chromosome segregation protein [Myoviridae sp. ctxlX31]
MKGIECPICHGRCDPGEMIGGVCLECREKEEQRQTSEDKLSKVMNSGYKQLTFDFKEERGLKITKLKIRNLFGIKEYEAGGESVELSGTNGVGKSSVIDAIKYALTNKSDRKYIVRNGETEGEVLIETDSGLRINRKARTNQADYKSVKNNGVEVGSPETFLKDIFTELQLNPVEFMSMTEKQQNAIILDMIEYDWDMNKIREWFGEIPAWVSYDQNILCVLNDIQSENGEYFKARQDINREIRNKKAFVEEIAATIPAGYSLEKWENASAGEIYQKIERIRKENEEIQKAKSLLDERDSKVRKFEADREINKAALTTEFGNRKAQIDKDIVQLQEQIKALDTERAGLDERLADKLAIIEQEYKANVAKYDAEVESYKDYRDKEVEDVSELVSLAEEIEKMKSHINEYRRMQDLQKNIEDLSGQSQTLTNRIEKARTLPGEILADCKIPIAGLTVKDGTPLINGLPISNLSDGEKLDLCIDVAIQNPKGLQIILIDGVERLSTEWKNRLYAKCKEKGLQFIATRTTDDEDMSVVEL